MSRSSFTRFTAAVLVAALTGATLAPCSALAQGAAPAAKPDKDTAAKARAAYAAGKAAFEANDFSTAAEKFREANTLIPSPHAQYWIATSLDRQGKVEEALKAYDKLMADPGKDKIGEDLVKTAEGRVAELKKTPGQVSVVTEPPGAGLMVDGEPQSSQTPTTLKLAPGTHTIQASIEGYESMTIEVEVAPGSEREQKLELVEKAAPVDPTPVPVTPPPPPKAAPPPEEEERSMIPAYVTLGVAGAGLVVGTIFGIQALGAKSDFDDNPTDSAADDVERNALIADMSFGVALTLGITGLVLLTAGDDPASEETGSRSKRRPSTARRSLRVAPYASPHGGGAAARFTF